MATKADTTPPIERHYSAASIAERYDVTAEHVRRLMDRGVLRFVLVGAARRVRESELLRFDKALGFTRPTAATKAVHFPASTRATQSAASARTT